jgi:hypothetical protein
MTGEYTFVTPERQNELTRLIQDKLTQAAKAAYPGIPAIHTHDDATVVILRRFGNNDPKVRSDARAWSRNQEGVAAAHPQCLNLSTAPYQCLYHGKTLNLALKVCDFRVSPVCGAEDIAVGDGN